MSSQIDAEPDDRSTARRQRAEEIRSRLLDAAEALYGEGGSHALTNRRIADAAATTTQSIYTFYGSRDDLVTAMFERIVAEAEALLDLPIPPPDAPLSVEEANQAFMTAALRYRDWCLANPGKFRLVRSAGGSDVPASAASLRERVVERLAATVDVRATDKTPDRIRASLASLHGFLMAELDGLIREEHDPARLYVELVVRLRTPFMDIPELPGVGPVN